MKLRFVYVDLSPEESVDLGDVRVVEVLDHWNTPRGQAVKLLVEEKDDHPETPGGYGG